MTDRKSTSMGAGFPWLFMGLTFGLSWPIMIAYILSGTTAQGATPALTIACSAPSLVGILLTYFTSDRAGWADFWKRVVSFKLIGLKWFAVIICLYPCLLVLGLLADKLFGGAFPPLGGAQQMLLHPAALLLIVGRGMMIGGPLSEELGWRGFALDRLQNRWNALTASLLLGIVWAVWHLPLFYIKGNDHTAMSFWLFSLYVVSLSVLMTWVYNNTQRSILSAILMHFMVNETYTFMAPDGPPLASSAFAAVTVMIVIAALVVVGRWGFKTLTLRSSVGRVSAA